MKKTILFLMFFCAAVLVMGQRPFGGVATKDTVTQSTDYTYTVASDAGFSPQIYAVDVFMDRVSGKMAGKVYIYRSLNNVLWYPIDTITVSAATSDTQVIGDYTTSLYADDYWGLLTKYYKIVVNNDSVGKFTVSGRIGAYKLPAR
jgi:hypothetical protein